MSSGFPGNILGGLGDIFGQGGPFGGGVGLPQFPPDLGGGAGISGSGAGLGGVNSQLDFMKQLDDFSEGVQKALALEQVRHKLTDKILDAMAQA